MNGPKSFFAVLILLGVGACDQQTTSSTSTERHTQGFMQNPANRAIEQLQSQLLINPNNFDALSRLGDLYFESGQYLLAIQSYERALTVRPDCANCLNDKGLAQFYMGDTEGALESLDQAMAVDPSYPNAWLSKGFVLISAGRDQEAIAPLRQVEALDPSGVLAAEAANFLATIEEKLPRE